MQLDDDAERSAQTLRRRAALGSGAGCGTASWIVVSNGVGLGVAPPTELGRARADELGRVNQIVAAAADDVYLHGRRPAASPEGDRRA